MDNMFVQKAFIEDLKRQIASLTEDNHRLVNTICLLSGVSTPFPVQKLPPPPITAGRKTWEVRRRELEARESGVAGN